MHKTFQQCALWIIVIIPKINFSCKDTLLKAISRSLNCQNHFEMLRENHSHMLKKIGHDGIRTVHILFNFFSGNLFETC